MGDDRTRLMIGLKRRIGQRRRPGSFDFEPNGIFRGGRIRRLLARLELARLSFVAAMAHDLEYGRGFPWLVVCFAIGVWGYFELPREPQPWATVPLAAFLAIFAFRRRRRGHAAIISLILASLATGVCAGNVRTWSVNAPRLVKDGTRSVTGWVEEVEPRERGYRLTIRPVRIGIDEGDALPRLVRVTGRAQPPPRPGDAITFRARLSPPQGPVLPGGYAFDRAAYFEQIGAYGFIYGRPEPALLGRSPGWRLEVVAAISRLRTQIGSRIREALPGDSGAIAAALIVGDRGAVSEFAQENLRIAGLAHVLAISGMHMALVAGAIFFVVRGGLALSPGLALNCPIRSWAAAAALVAATAYLVISGASIATQRAYVMAAVIFVSMIVGRPAVTMRSVALAAAIVLALSPEALLQPGFQMSFLAVIALVAAYRGWFEWRKGSPRIDASELVGRSRLLSAIRFVGFWVGGLAMTSVIAGVATGPVALAHFYRASPLGLVANMAAMPFVSLLIMPFAVVSVLAMPFGLDPLTLQPMGIGIDAMLAIAGKVAGWTPSGGVVGALGDWPAVLSAAGLLWLALWTSRWRLLGIIPVVAALGVAGLHERPDILISEDGRTIAVRTPQGPLAVSTGPGGRFAAEIWLKADGDPASLSQRKANAQVMRCDDRACVFQVAGAGDHHGSEGQIPHAAAPGTPSGASIPLPGPLQQPDRSGVGLTPIARSREMRDREERAPAVTDTAPVGSVLVLSRVERPEAFDEDCRRADIIVTHLEAPKDCALHALVIDTRFLEMHGAAALFLKRPPPGQRVLSQPNGPVIDGNDGGNDDGNLDRNTPAAAMRSLTGVRRLDVGFAHFESARSGINRPWQPSGKR
ncbi:competence protein ComEC [Breoghania corrubedonensis]|uniref:Competence protein ComEC n=2 Tax=Breoghania corrubedonensis TaxID=665038 RepID=A0A2T5VBM0_9HYPH|nr:competence protein ComEC [Breoghania corrubedonensis]